MTIVTDFNTGAEIVVELVDRNPRIIGRPGQIAAMNATYWSANTPPKGSTEKVPADRPIGYPIIHVTGLVREYTVTRVNRDFHSGDEVLTLLDESYETQQLEIECWNKVIEFSGIALVKEYFLGGGRVTILRYGEKSFVLISEKGRQTRLAVFPGGQPLDLNIFGLSAAFMRVNGKDYSGEGKYRIHLKAGQLENPRNKIEEMNYKMGEMIGKIIGKVGVAQTEGLTATSRGVLTCDADQGLISQIDFDEAPSPSASDYNYEPGLAFTLTARFIQIRNDEGSVRSHISSIPLRATQLLGGRFQKASVRFASSRTLMRFTLPYTVLAVDGTPFIVDLPFDPPYDGKLVIEGITNHLTLDGQSVVPSLWDYLPEPLQKYFPEFLVAFFVAAVVAALRRQHAP